MLRRAGNLKAGSINRRILSAAATVGLLTLGVKLLEALSHLIVAYHFGTRDAVDAFTIAFVVPSFLLNVMAGSVAGALMPTYISVAAGTGPGERENLLASLSLLHAALLVSSCLLLAVSARFLVAALGSGFPPHKQFLTRTLLYLLIPVLFFSGFSRLWAAVLNAGERFVLAAAAPAVRPLAAIVLLLLAARQWGIHALAAGMVIGAAAEAVLVGWDARKRGLLPFPRWGGWNPALKQVIREFAPMAGGVFLYGSTEMVDQAMAAMLGSGSVAVLGYGNRLVLFFLVVVAGALGTAFLPHFSRLAAEGAWDRLQHTLRSYRRWILLVGAAVSLGLLWASEPLVRLVFQRGAFTAQDTFSVARVQAVYGLQITFFLLNILYVRLLSALKQNRHLFVAALVCVPLNAGLNLVLMRFWGVSGIALSTVIVQAVTCLLLASSTRRELGRAASAVLQAGVDRAA